MLLIGTTEAGASIPSRRRRKEALFRQLWLQ